MPTMNDYTLKKLPNGLRLLSVPMEGVKSVTVLALAGVGSRYESEQKAGIAHVLEHMVFKDTHNYPTAMDISVAIDSVGGEHNAFTSKDYTGYYVKVASSQMELALDVISDMLLEPKLKPQDLEREKRVIIEEINMYEDDPRSKVANTYEDLIFQNSALGRDIIGSKETVSQLSSNDLAQFLDSWYDFSNVVLVITGDETKLKSQDKSLQNLVYKYFNKGKSRSGKGEKFYSVPLQGEPRVKLIKRKTEQAHFYLGFPGMGRRHPLRYAASVLATILGGNSSARLFNEIREKRGLAYYAYASLSSFEDTGTLYAFEGVDPAKIEDAIGVTLEQFKAIQETSNSSLTELEVKRAKEFIRGKLTLDWEDSHSIAMTYGKKLLLEEKIQTPDEILSQISAVELAQVQKSAQELIDKNRINLALIGPYRNEEKFSKLIQKV